MGPDHPDVAKALNNLGTALQERGHYEVAEQLYQRTWRSTSGPPVPTTHWWPPASTTWRRSTKPVDSTPMLGRIRAGAGDSPARVRTGQHAGGRQPEQPGHLDPEGR